jgi:hypothetical protein
MAIRTKLSKWLDSLEAKLQGGIDFCQDRSLYRIQEKAETEEVEASWPTVCPYEHGTVCTFDVAKLSDCQNPTMCKPREVEKPLPIPEHTGAIPEKEEWVE